jgi:hypothetical protein
VLENLSNEPTEIQRHLSEDEIPNWQTRLRLGQVPHEPAKHIVVAGTYGDQRTILPKFD